MAFNAGGAKILRYCATNNPEIKRPCSDAGKLVEQVIGAPNYGMIGVKDPVGRTKYRVSNTYVQNYIPNFKTIRWDNVQISSHGYIEEVASRIKKYTCF